MFTLYCADIAMLNAAIDRLDPFQVIDRPTEDPMPGAVSDYREGDHYESGVYPVASVVPVRSAITGETFNVQWID